MIVETFAQLPRCSDNKTAARVRPRDLAFVGSTNPLFNQVWLLAYRPIFIVWLALRAECSATTTKVFIM